jgi:hypothetical protein
MGRATKNKIIKTSTTKIERRINEVTKINTVFMTIPKKIEKRTSPSRYSFFKGLKKVFSKFGSEKSLETYRLKATKKLKSPAITSLYQKTNK